MVEIAELVTDRTLLLPIEVAERFHPADRFVVWSEGDILHLKRITPLSVTAVVESAPEGDALSLDEINAIVHEVRQHHQGA